ncbi:MAG TPA: hypothetical protein VGM82_08875 [Gemmatimonadaceae bacterium]|jgi:hypothetical protein
MPSDLSELPTRPRDAALTVALLAVIASITGIGNRFAYDDVALIATNDRVHSLQAFWQRFAEPYWPETFAHTLYRPITTLGFAFQWTAGAGSPFVFHLVSILLYAACAVGVLLLARQILWPTAAWFAAALFAVHPVHVEAVANVVGQAELVATGAIVFAAWWYLRARRSGALSARDVGVVALLYAIGLLAKEGAIVLPALLVAAELTVIRRVSAQRSIRLAAWVPTLIALACVAIALLFVRRAVIGSWLGDFPIPALENLSSTERVLTMLAASREWIRLLIWPSLLSFSYSPPYLDIVKAPALSMVYGVVLIVGVVMAVVTTQRRAPAIAFGALWFAIAILPVSNLFFVSGVFIAERTLFAPSVGFVFVVAGVLELLWPRVKSAEARRALTIAMGVVLFAGALRSMLRQRAWFDTAHITTAGVRDLPDAYTVDALYGEDLATRRAYGTAEKWLRRSIALFGTDPEVHVELANLYVSNNQWAAAESTFNQALAIDPKLSSARAGLVLCLVHAKNYVDARKQAEIGVASGESVETFTRLVAAIDSAAKMP